MDDKSTALLVGSYVDAHFEGTLNIFRAKNPEIFKKNGELKSDYIKADEINHKPNESEMELLYAIYDGEKQTIMTAEICWFSMENQN